VSVRWKSGDMLACTEELAETAARVDAQSDNTPVVGRASASLAISRRIALAVPIACRSRPWWTSSGSTAVRGEYQAQSE
jgi:hypothetical protein